MQWFVCNTSERILERVEVEPGLQCQWPTGGRERALQGLMNNEERVADVALANVLFGYFMNVKIAWLGQQYNQEVVLLLLLVVMFW